MESYPRQCRTPDGRTFVEEIPDTNEPPSETCKNLCGDGQCQEVVCLAVGCPCAETARSCPQDCAAKPVVCTADAKLCPDGSYVSRVAPNCEFAPCPPPYRECRSYASCQNDAPCLAGTECSGLPAYGCYPPGCPTPICLASNTLIATPDGDVNVDALAVGMRVWSRDARGNRIAVPVLELGRTPVGAAHQLIHLVLSDGRELWASPGHPTADGRTVDQLTRGDRIDGATVEFVGPVSYWDDATYDLRPAGETGEYWANGIPMDTTLP